MAGRGSDRQAERRTGSDPLASSRRRFLGATGATLAGLGLGTSPAAARHSGGVTIVHDTHFHGRFGDLDAEGEDPQVNIAKYHTAVEQLLDEHDNAAFVGVGDDFSPSLMGLTYEGEHMVEALNEMPVVANGVGNHEFDFGAEVAQQRFRDSEFTWVAANLLTGDEEPIPGTERWTTEEVGDVTVGFFGSGVGDFHGITDYPDEYISLDPVEASREATQALRDEGADVVVMLSHVSSGTHEDIAQAVDGLDAIVGSHSGTVFEEPKEISGTVISEVGDEFDYLGAVTLNADGTLADWRRVEVTPDLDPHPDTRAIVETWKGRLEERLGQTYFTSGGVLDARFSTNYARESGLGNLITDVMREHAGADVGIQNAGGIRSNSIYGPGPITGADVMNILPFPNTVVELEVGGATLEQFLTDRIAALPAADFGAQPSIQISGVQYEWSGHGEGSVENVYVGGEPLDPDATYTVATNDYVAENRDAFADIEWEYESDELLGTIVLDALETRGHVEPEVENRILRVDEDVGGADVTGGDDAVTATFDLPDAAEGVYPTSFTAVNQFGHAVDAADVAVSGGTVEATFDADSLRVLATGAEVNLRLFGGFEPNDAHYGYEDEEGNVRDLPVAGAWPYYVLKADLDAGAGALAGARRGESEGDGGDATATPTPTPAPTEEPTDEATDASNASAPGFGVAAGLAGAAGAGAYLLRNGDDE